jgi:hypothetical protein
VALVLASIVAVVLVSVSTLWVYKFTNATPRFRHGATAAAISLAVAVVVAVVISGGAVDKPVVFAACVYSGVMLFAWQIHAALDGIKRVRHR